MAGEPADTEDSAKCTGAREPSDQERLETGQRRTCVPSALSDHRQVQVLDPRNQDGVWGQRPEIMRDGDV